MHDLSQFRSDFERIASRLATRGPIPQLDDFRALDQKRRATISQAEELKKQKNAASAEVNAARKTGVDTTERQKELRALGEEISARDEQVKAIEAQFQELL